MKCTYNNSNQHNTFETDNTTFSAVVSPPLEEFEELLEAKTEVSSNVALSTGDLTTLSLTQKTLHLN